MTFGFDNSVRLKSSWNPGRFLVGKKLTDRRIEQYRKAGWYSEEFREARRELMAKNRVKRAVREGSFLKQQDGRLIYAP